MKTLKVEGEVYKVRRSSRKNKKFAVDFKGKTIHFGAKGYSIAPGTKKGDNYCARSSGIKGADNPSSPNFWSRKMWKCKGKKSIKS